MNQPVTGAPSIVFVVRRERELRPARHVGRAGDLVLVPADEDAVLRGDEVGLDEVGALLDRQAVGLDRVLGPLPARAPVRDDDRLSPLPLPAAVMPAITAQTVTSATEDLVTREG